jgi:FKBP-type peptidyl-prolyl cis-trans isomerase SlyD
MSKSYLCVLAAAAVLAGGCSKKPAVGTTVKFNYTLTVDGKMLETSVGAGKEPATVILGKHSIIPGLEDALAGMKIGEKRKVTVTPEKGYGPYHPEGVTVVPKSSFQNGAAGLKPGMMVSGHGADGRPFPAKVTKVDADSITLDMNHPLAGKTLNFDVEVLSVKATGS